MAESVCPVLSGAGESVFDQNPIDRLDWHKASRYVDRIFIVGRQRRCPVSDKLQTRLNPERKQRLQL